jgi:hypothetical protein
MNKLIKQTQFLINSPATLKQKLKMAEHCQLPCNRHQQIFTLLPEIANQINQNFTHTLIPEINTPINTPEPPKLPKNMQKL